MKLANFAALDPEYPGAELIDGGRGDRETWDRFINDTAELRRLAHRLWSAGARRGSPSRAPVDLSARSASSTSSPLTEHLARDATRPTT
jgi:hypothetical protein